MKKKIHVFCLKPPICSLIKKRFANSDYMITCSNADDIREELFESLKKNLYFIIIDRDTKPELKEKIKRYFKNKPIICLPSLDYEEQNENDMKNISEPLRLSELADTLDGIFSVK